MNTYWTLTLTSNKHEPIYLDENAEFTFSEYGQVAFDEKFKEKLTEKALKNHLIYLSENEFTPQFKCNDVNDLKIEVEFKEADMNIFTHMAGRDCRFFRRPYSKEELAKKYQAEIEELQDRLKEIDKDIEDLEDKKYDVESEIRELNIKIRALKGDKQ